MLVNSSWIFRDQGMDWLSYYNQNGTVKFPEKDVNGWNQNDHGVNNAEGAMRWKATM